MTAGAASATDAVGGTWIKVCGHRELASAEAAARSGADAVGFVFAASPRRVEPGTARGIIGSLPRGLAKIGVFVNEEVDRLLATAAECGLTGVQLHGGEGWDYVKAVRDAADRQGLRLQIIVALRADAAGRGAMGRGAAPAPGCQVDAFLLDAYHPALAGGTGRSFNWAVFPPPGAWGRPVYLAGGLTPGNVGEALRATRAAGVDVSSGVETDGCKDPAKIRAFCEAVREWEREVSR